MRSFVADGNFKAIHLKQKDDESDVWLTSGEGFMTNEPRYQRHLGIALESKSVSIHGASLLLSECTSGSLMPSPSSPIE